ncbi:hypothetical protein [Hymenobacter sp. HD11105]
MKSMDAQTLAGRRDRVIRLRGFTSAFRRSELTALNLPGLFFSAEGLIVNLARSQTNQHGAAEKQAIFTLPISRFALFAPCSPGCSA